MKTKMTDKEFASHFAGPNSVSKYTLEEGIKRAKMRDSVLSPMLKAGMDYAQAAALADKVVVECFGE